MKAEIIQRPSDEDLLKEFLESPTLEHQQIKRLHSNLDSIIEEAEIYKSIFLK